MPLSVCSELAGAPFRTGGVAVCRSRWVRSLYDRLAIIVDCFDLGLRVAMARIISAHDALASHAAMNLIVLFLAAIVWRHIPSKMNWWSHPRINALAAETLAFSRVLQIERSHAIRLGIECAVIIVAALLPHRASVSVASYTELATVATRVASTPPIVRSWARIDRRAAGHRSSARWAQAARICKVYGSRGYVSDQRIAIDIL